MSEIWLGTYTGADEGSVQCLVETKREAWDWIRAAREEAVRGGKRMEEYENERAEEHGYDRDDRHRELGWWLPTPIQERDDGPGWYFYKTQGGSLHGKLSVHPVELPHYGWYVRDFDTEENQND